MFIEPNISTSNKNVNTSIIDLTSNEIQADKFITLAEVIDVVGFKKTKIHKMITLKTFPTQIKIGTSSRWSRNEINAWVKKQILNRNPGK